MRCAVAYIARVTASLPSNLDTLIKHGTDRYGPVKTPMLMSILDVYTRHSPEDPPMLDGMIRTEERPDHGRRSPAGCKL